MTRKEYRAKFCTTCKENVVMKMRLLDEHGVKIIEESYEGGIWFGDKAKCSKCMAKEEQVYYFNVD